MSTKHTPTPWTLRLDAPITNRNRAHVIGMDGERIAEFFVHRPRHGFGGGRNWYQAFINGESVASGDTVKETLAHVAIVIAARAALKDAK